MSEVNEGSLERVEILYVTPKQAAAWLEKNQVNRNMRTSLVNAYRRDMEAGRWEFTAEPVQISRTGQLLNGQHRLAALSSSKGVKSLKMVVAQGLPDRVQEMMDQGKPRTARDALLIRHGGYVKNVTLVASISRWMVLNPEPGPQMTPASLRGKVTAAEIIEMYEAHPEIEEASEVGQRIRQQILPGSPTAIGYSWLALRAVHKEKCTEFFNGMIDMDFTLKNDPRKAVIRRMQYIHRDTETPTSLETGVMMVSVLTRAWNAWRKGEEVESLQVRSRAGLILPVKPR